MVAMGTSLSDRAWDRESAVYRISGVFAVIGGWFLTALIAFSVSGLIALIISLSGKWMIFVFVAVAVFMVMRTQVIFRKRSASKIADEEDLDDEDAYEQIIDKSSKQVIKAVVSSNQIVTMGMESFIKENRGELLTVMDNAKQFNKKAKKNRDKVYSAINKFVDGALETSHFYVQMMEHKREVAHALHFLVLPMLEHIENNHKPFTSEQGEELKDVATRIDSFFNYMLHVIKEENFEDLESVIEERDKILDILSKMEKNQIKRIKNKLVNTRNSQLFFKIISEIEHLLLHSVNLVKAQRDFITQTRQLKQ
jgi:Na+/phosphate symporter